MEVKEGRKTDRRTLNTKTLIQESLLSLLAEKEYSQISVAELCRRAGINRGTFYLHYNNLRQVIDALFDEALSDIHSLLKHISLDAADDDKCVYGLCRFLRNHRKYQPLFFSASLHDAAVDRLAALDQDEYLERIKADKDMPMDVLLALLYFQINGCLAICKRNIGISDSAWETIQCTVDRFLKHGFEKL